MPTHGNDNQVSDNTISRRTVLKSALAVGAGVTATSAGVLGAATPASAAISHPGLLHTQADFDRMAAQVAAGAQPWQAGCQRLIDNPHSHPDWTPNPQETIKRGGGSGQNYPILYNDVHAAYQNALRWKIQNNTEHGDTARDICNAWSATLQEITGDTNASLAVGIYGYQFANVGEIMRDYPGFDLGRFQQMMNDVFYTWNLDFLVRRHGTCPSHYWANWDLCNMNSILAIGVLTDDQSKIDWVVDYFYNGVGQGSILNAIPHLHENDTLGQWQESGRDQGHTLMGVGQMGAFCEMAWNQGYDLYGAHDSRFMKACEYIARYNLGNSVPFTDYYWESGHNCDPNWHTQISDHSRGQHRPVWERVYNHYAVRRGLSVPYTEQFATEVRPEGGGGDYGSTSGGFDQLGFGTLTCTRTSAGSGREIVSGATYTLVCELSGKALDNGNVTTEGASVIQWTGHGEPQQRWQITDVGDGYYKLVCELSGMALDNGNVPDDGASVIQWTDNGGAPQRWQIVDVGGGYHKLINENSGKALDNGNVSADGASVIQWTDHGEPQQRWRLTRVG